MDNSDEDNSEKWILVDSLESEEGNYPLYVAECIILESDLDSDDISIITHNESSAEEECGSITDNNMDVLNKKEDTKKWTFADSEMSETILGHIHPKTFFLNCSEEPVQELSEHELEFRYSNPDTDEVALNSENDSELKNENIENKKLGLMFRVPAYNQNNFYGLLIATLILAAISIYLEDYLNCTDQVTDELHFPQDINNISEGLSDNIDKIFMKYNISTSMYFCEQKYKSGTDYLETNIQKCLFHIQSDIKNTQESHKTKEMEQLEKNLKIKEHYLNEKEKYLINREYELMKTEMKIELMKSQFNFKKKIKNNLEFGPFKKSSIHHEFRKHLGYKKIKSENKINDKGNNHNLWKINKKRHHFYEHKNEYSKSYFSTNKINENKKAKKNDKTKSFKISKGLNDKEKQPNYKYDRVKKKGMYQRTLSK